VSSSVHIVIVNWNAGDRLPECLSIARTPRSGFRIARVTIGDNVSSDNSAVDLEEIALPLDVIRNEPTSAFATARNQGAPASPGDYLLFLNPDAHLFPDTDWPWSHPDSSVAFLGDVGRVNRYGPDRARGSRS
jgi:N-acetylglucosaminyl-diphospho-decaprenol L-rhamnosyltransferase